MSEIKSPSKAIKQEAVKAFRIEKDFLGEKRIPEDAYYGVQTLRGKENFHITGVPMSLEPNFVKAFGYVKKAAALANRDLGVVDKKVANAIAAACDRLIAGEFRDQFITDFIQGGAGTSTNMNANEVIANIALESLGEKKGNYAVVNPNDHVNFGQSTNDVYPTAFRLALILRLESYMQALTNLQKSFFKKAKEFDKVLKMGRTHLQDAVPMSLGAEFHGWGTTIGEEVERIAEVRQFLHEINLGATAIGTTVTAAPGYPELATKYLSEVTGRKFILAGDLVEATSDTGAYVLLSGVLKRTSCKLTKICNDLRLLASGPRCGFNEINLPQMQPGSSIMPGKVNPVIPEVVNQTSFLVIGLDLTVTLAASAGQLQLNVMEPVITFALFTSIATMEHAVDSLRANCVDGITANSDRTRDMVLNSLGIITVLKPSLGYKACADIAKEGYETGKSLHDIVVKERKLLTQQKWDEVFAFENLINPKFEQ
ncbi:MAG TPA: aspartate ammonia-lyase [Usitatibacter sp.]|jgi:aspartate ammonia-lyase|nr:aspartate ammonia-lyase [Usitatibacter sp.]